MVVATDEMEFLKQLDDRLSEERPCSVVFGGIRMTSTRKFFRAGAKLTSEEMARVLGLANKRDYAIEPCGADNFHPGFYVHAVTSSGAELKAERVLAVRENQFPEGFQWGSLAEVYMQSRNLELLQMAGRQTPKSFRERYDY